MMQVSDDGWAMWPNTGTHGHDHETKDRSTMSVDDAKACKTAIPSRFVTITPMKRQMMQIVSTMRGASASSVKW